MCSGRGWSRPESEVVAHVNETRPLLLLEIFEEPSTSTGFLRSDLLPRLEPGRPLACGDPPAVNVWLVGGRVPRLLLPAGAD